MILNSPEVCQIFQGMLIGRWGWCGKCCLKLHSGPGGSGWWVVHLPQPWEVIGYFNKSCFGAMKWAKAWLEVFVKTIVREVIMNLRGNCFFPEFLKGRGGWRLGGDYWSCWGQQLLRIGVIADDLRGDGTVPKLNKEWIIAVIRGVRDWIQPLTSIVGRGSSWLAGIYCIVAIFKGCWFHPVSKMSVA